MKVIVSFSSALLFFAFFSHAQSIDKDLWSTTDYINHVIVLYDRSKSMVDNDKGGANRRVIFNELSKIMFDSKYVIPDRALYDTSKGDLFSFIAFNIQVGQNVETSLVKPIERAAKGYDRSKLTKIVNEQYQNRRYDGLTALTFARPLALASVDKNKENKVNRTFVVLISDGFLNQDKLSDNMDEHESEIRSLKNNSITFGAAINLYDQYYHYFEEVRIGKTFSSGELSLKIFEIIPKTNDLLEQKLFDVPNPVLLEKTPNGFSYKLPNYINSGTSLFQISKVTSTIEDNTGKVLSEGNEKEIHYKVQQSGLTLHVKLWVNYKDSIYGATVLHPDGSNIQGRTHLNFQVPIKFGQRGIIGLGQFGSFLYKLSSTLVGDNPMANNWFWGILLALGAIGIIRSWLFQRKIKDFSINSIERNDEIVVDFKDDRSKPNMEILERFEITITKASSIFGLKAKFQNISIKDLKYSKNIVVKDPEKLILIEYANILPNSSISNIAPGSYKTHLKVLIDKSQIKDYLNHNSSQQEIICTLLVESSRYQKSTSLKFSISFKRGKFDLKFTSSLHKTEFENGISYTKGNHQNIGFLQIENNSLQTFNEPINAELDIITTHNSLCFFRENSAINSGIKISENKLTFKDYVPTQEMKNRTIMDKINIGIDFDKIKNPSSRLDCLVEFIWNPTKFLSTLDPLSITIIPDNTVTSLQAIIENDQLKRYVHDLEVSHRWNKNEKGTRTLFSISLGNLAKNKTDGQGVVTIEKLAFEIINPEVTTPSPQEFLLINKTPWMQFKPKIKYVIEDGADPEEFSFSFKHQDINSIEDHVQKIRMKIFFQYSVSTDHVEDFNTEIHFELEEDPGRNWLAIDFGTSAIVMAHQELKSNGEAKPINLKNALNLNYSKDEEFEESDDFILSSKILLRNEGYSISDQFNYHLVKISPPVNELGNEFNRTIPYIKALIGDENIPNSNNRLENFAYYEKERSHEKDNSHEKDAMKLINGKNNLLKVEEVISSAFYSLIKHFVVNSINEIPNRVIFSVPNTFSYLQYSIIRDAVLGRFDFFWKKHIASIRESDAVVYYYNEYWRELNKKSIEHERPETEYILVYDMGAGTLDITYCSIIMNHHYKKLEIKQIGNIGSTTAGNYLDYVIASSLTEQVNNPSYLQQMLKIVEDNSYSDSALINHAINLKKYIISDIKPAILSGENNVFLNQDVLTGEIDLTEILTKPGVEKYVKINSFDILENLFNLYPKIDNEDITAIEKGKFKLDTVIFTGRGSQFPPLRKALKEAIKKWTSTPENIHYIDDLNGPKLKSIVVEGALLSTFHLDGNTSFEQETPIFARYGVIYTQEQKTKFVELLHPKSEPDKVPSSPGVLQSWSKKERLDLRESKSAFFVQSFAYDTAFDWSNGNKSFITVLFEFTTEEVSPIKAGRKDQNQSIEVGIEIYKDERGYLYLKLKAGNDEFDERSTGMFDKSKESIFQKSMWPFPV